VVSFYSFFGLRVSASRQAAERQASAGHSSSSNARQVKNDVLETDLRMGISTQVILVFVDKPKF
jgi:hypothetical protein